MFTVVTSDRFADHLTPPGHPERVARAYVMQALAATWRERGGTVLEPRPATRDELLRVHSSSYLDRIAATAGRAVALDPDTYTSPDSAEVAALAAGAAIVGVDSVLAGVRNSAGEQTVRESERPSVRESIPGAYQSAFRTSGLSDYRSSPVRSALVLVRPPGHHAETSRAMGFCLYNNVAVAASHAIARGLARVAIVDYDVHHANGTQWTFYRDPRVLVISTHQFPFYPGTGSAGEAGVGDGEGSTINVPLEAGATDGDYEMVFEQVVSPVLAAWRPELLLVSAGFDAHMRDPLANMRLSVAGLSYLARRLRDAAASSGCPIVFVTEGGYHLNVLGACLSGIVELLGHREGLPVPRAATPPGRPPARNEAPTSSPEANLAPSSATRGLHAATLEPRHPDQAPLIEDASTAPTWRGDNAVTLVRAAQDRHWPGL